MGRRVTAATRHLTPAALLLSVIPFRINMLILCMIIHSKLMCLRIADDNLIILWACWGSYANICILSAFI